jgi:DNA mismatch repair protein MutL
MAVRRLDTVLVDRIAAGVVVERPAAAVKELVENALDAGARRIAITCEAGGRRLIRVVDDGAGMAADDLDLAVERHATSQLPDGDLFAIATLGFRGEALPSIAAVAQVSCTSRTRDAAQAVELRIAGSEIQDKRTVGAPVGTTFLIRNLFYNLPVRREFLRSAGAETAAIATIMTQYALAYPHIRFTFNVDGKTRLSSNGTGQLRDVLLAVYGIDVVSHLLPVDYSRGDGIYALAINGFISDPTISRGTREAMHISVNGRAIAPRGQLAAIFDEAYHTLLMKGRFPYVVVAMHVDPAAVDVNVHPTKSEVKFRDPEYVRNNLADAMRQLLHQSSTIQDWGVPPQPTPTGTTPPPPRATAEPRTSYTDSRTPPASPPRPSGGGQPMRERPLFPETPVSRPVQQRFDQPPRADAQAAGVAVAAQVAANREAQTGPLPELRIIGQLAGLYIFAEGPNQECYVIDQHAAHERINYERLMAQHAHGKIETQPLLMAQHLHFAPATHGILLDHRTELQQWGFRLDEHENQLVVRAIPATVSPNRLEAALVQIADFLAGAGGSLPSDWQEKMLITLACHTSIRAGQNLSLAEQQALISQLSACTGPRTCPHGRPTIITMRLDLFARQFGRIV